VMRALLFFAPRDVLQMAAYLDLICLQVANEFCYTKFVDALVVMAEQGDFTDARAQIWCHPCVEAFAYRYVATIQALVGVDAPTIAEELMFLGFRKFMCVKNRNGYCFPQIQAAQPSFATLGTRCGAHAYLNDTCPADCKETITGIKTNLGCCFGTWFNFVRFQFATNITFRQTLQPLTPAMISDFTSSQCGVTVPSGCATEKLLVKLYLAGLNAMWVEQHQPEIKRAVINYIVFLLAVDNSSIFDLVVGPSTVTGASVQASAHHLMQANPTTMCTFTLRGDSQEQVDSAKTALAPASISENPSTAILVSLPIESRDQSNISQPCYAQSAEVQALPDTSSAFARAPTFVALVFGILALLML